MWKRCIAFVLATCLTLVLFIVYNMFNGNPVSKYFASRQIKQYVDENYGHLDIESIEYSYTFKDSHYYGNVNVRNSEDGDFRVSLMNDGRILDEYEYMVLGGNNILNRLFVELKEESDMYIEAYFDGKKSSDGQVRFDFGYLDFDGDLTSLPLDTPLSEAKQVYPLKASVYLNGKLDSDQAMFEELKGFLDYMSTKGYGIQRVSYNDDSMYISDLPIDLVQESGKGEMQAYITEN